MHPPEETIVALSTPPGRGGIAIVRLSGPDALRYAMRVFQVRGNHQISPGIAALGWIQDAEDHRPLDRGYLTFHPSGRSYTGEELVELSCHGSPVLVEQLLGLLVQAGARQAERGEFTYRAVLNGRMDLAQAEGVRDLIDSPTAVAARGALSQVRGDLSRRITTMREDLIEIISRLEAGLEFAEEPDVVRAEGGISPRLRDLSSIVGRFVATYRQGRLVRHGARVVLAGRPNTGKSSLFNTLLGTERAIVSNEEGTTRDFISERIELDGIQVTLFDTAGLRQEALGVEAQGVSRANHLLREADLILLLCGCDEEPDDQDLRVMSDHAGRIMLVASKSDLLRREPPVWAAASPRASAATGEGVSELRRAIFEMLVAAPVLSNEEILIGDSRHHEALVSCSRRLSRAREALDDGVSDEVVLVDLYAALSHLGEITGVVTLTDIHERIFSTFCIGK